MTVPSPKGGRGLAVIAFDLDGTLAEPTWPAPHIGQAIAKGIAALMEYVDQGYEIIVWTARPAYQLDTIRQWLWANGLAHLVYTVVTDKPRAALYIDDRAAKFPEEFD